MDARQIPPSVAIMSRHTVEFESFVAPKFEGCVTKSAPREALKVIAWCKLTFDESVVLCRVDGDVLLV